MWTRERRSAAGRMLQDARQPKLAGRGNHRKSGQRRSCTPSPWKAGQPCSRQPERATDPPKSREGDRHRNLCDVTVNPPLNFGHCAPGTFRRQKGRQRRKSRALQSGSARPESCQRRGAPRPASTEVVPENGDASDDGESQRPEHARDWAVDFIIIAHGFTPWSMSGPKRGLTRTCVKTTRRNGSAPRGAKTLPASAQLPTPATATLRGGIATDKRTGAPAIAGTLHVSSPRTSSPKGKPLLPNIPARGRRGGGCRPMAGSAPHEKGLRKTPEPRCRRSGAGRTV